MGLSVEVMQSDLPLALDLVSDILRNSTFEPPFIAREQEALIASGADVKRASPSGLLPAAKE